MKKKIIIIIVSVLLVAALSVGTVFIVKAVKNKDKNGDTPVTPYVTLSDVSLDLTYGDVYTVVADHNEIDGLTLTWSSANEGVAAVENGKVTAVGAGETVITATFGTAKAECSVKVGYSGLVPELKIRYVANDKIRMTVGSSFDIDAYVYFNGKDFDCEISGESANTGVASYEDGKITAKGIGSTQVTVKTGWNSFDNALTEKTLTVEVINDVNLTSVITVGGTPAVTDSVKLSVTPSFGGNAYDNFATVNFVAKENGVSKTLNGAIVSGDDVITIDGGVITAIGAGKATVRAEYTDENGSVYACTIEIEVYVPVIEYGEEFELCVKNPFPVEDVFGAGATVISAAQNGAEVTVNGGVLGITPNGKNTAAFEVLTTKGGYRFTNVIAYTGKITTASEFKNAFGLVYNKATDGYYVLGNDVGGIDAATYQGMPGGETTYFKGTLDGCGYTVTATAGENGIFGSLANGATIKNTKFVLTFPDSQACGFSKNSGTFNKDVSVVTLENLYIETTNYYANSTVLMDQKPDKLVMKDVFVKINGNAALGEYTDSSTRRNALFRLDQSLNDGRYGQFNGDFRRVYVVTETFIPVACGGNWKDFTFVSYAVNDVEKLGKFIRNNGNSDNWGYCKIANANPSGDAKTKLFGYEDPSDKNAVYTFIYGARPDISGGGVYRYDTVAELTGSGVTKVGDWTIA